MSLFYWLLCFSITGSRKDCSIRCLCFDVVFRSTGINCEIVNLVLKFISRKSTFSQLLSEIMLDFTLNFLRLFLWYRYILSVHFFMENWATKWCHFCYCSCAVTKVTMIGNFKCIFLKFLFLRDRAPSYGGFCYVALELGWQDWCHCICIELI